MICVELDCIILAVSILNHLDGTCHEDAMVIKNFKFGIDLLLLADSIFQNYGHIKSMV